MKWSEIKKEKYKTLIDRVYAILAYGTPEQPLYDKASEIVFEIMRDTNPFRGIVADDGFGELKEKEFVTKSGKVLDSTDIDRIANKLEAELNEKKSTKAL